MRRLIGDVAEARLKDLSEEPKTAEEAGKKLLELMSLGDDSAILPIFRDIIWSGGGIGLLHENGDPVADFGVHPDEARSLLDRLLGVTRTGEFPSNTRSRSSLHAKVRIPKPVADALGLDRYFKGSAEVRSKYGLIRHKGAWYMSGKAVFGGLRADSLREVQKEGRAWVEMHASGLAHKEAAAAIGAVLSTDDALDEQMVNRFTSPRRREGAILAHAWLAARDGALGVPVRYRLNGREMIGPLIRKLEHSMRMGAGSRLDKLIGVLGGDGSSVRLTRLALDYVAGLAPGADKALQRQLEGAKRALEFQISAARSRAEEFLLRADMDAEKAQAEGAVVATSADNLREFVPANIDSASTRLSRLADAYEAVNEITNLVHEYGLDGALQRFADLRSRTPEVRAEAEELAQKLGYEGMARVAAMDTIATAMAELINAEGIQSEMFRSPGFQAGATNGSLRSVIGVGHGGGDRLVDSINERYLMELSDADKERLAATAKRLEEELPLGEAERKDPALLANMAKAGITEFTNLIEMYPEMRDHIEADVYEALLEGDGRSVSRTLRGYVYAAMVGDSYVEEAVRHGFSNEAEFAVHKAMREALESGDLEGFPSAVDSNLRELLSKVDYDAFFAGKLDSLSGTKDRRQFVGEAGEEARRRDPKDFGLGDEDQIAREVAKRSGEIAGFLMAHSIAATHSRETKDAPFWAFIGKLRGGTPVSEWSESLRAELSKRDEELGRPVLLHEENGEWVIDYENYGEYILHGLKSRNDALVAAMGWDGRGPGCSCEGPLTAFIKAEEAMWERANAFARLIRDKGLLAVRRVNAHLAARSAGWKKIGDVMAKIRRDILHVGREMRRGVDLSVYGEDLSPRIKRAMKGIYMAGQVWARSMDDLGSALTATMGKKAGAERLEKLESLMVRYWQDTPRKAGLSLEGEVEANERRHRRIELLVERRYPELKEALAAVQMAMRAEETIYQIAAEEGLLSKRQAIKAGTFLGQVFLARAKSPERSARPGGSQLRVSRDMFGPYKGRKRIGSSDELIPLYDSSGNINSKHFLGRALNAVTTMSSVPKLAGAELVHNIRGLLDEWGQKELSEEELNDTVFGRPMYRKFGDGNGSGSISRGIDWILNTFELRNSGRSETSKELGERARRALRAVLEDKEGGKRRLKELDKQIAETENEEEKKLLKERRKLVKSYHPIGGWTGKIAKLIKDLETTYLPAEVVAQLEHEFLQMSGYYKVNLLHRFGTAWASVNTVLRPKHYATTFLSFVALNHLAGGLPLALSLKYYKDAYREVTEEKGTYYDEIAHRLPSRGGVVDYEVTQGELDRLAGAGHVRAHDLGDPAEQVGQYLDEVRNFKGLDELGDSLAYWVNKKKRSAFDFYRRMELAGKLSLYRWYREQGIPVQEAWNRAKNVTVDPNTTPAWMRQAGSGYYGGHNTHGLLQVKFINWPLRVMPTVAEMVWNRPVTTARAAITMSLLAQALAYAFGYSDDEMEDERASVRRERGGLGELLSRPFRLPLPKTSTGRYRALDLYHATPFEAVQGLGSMPSIQPAQLLAELWTGHTFGPFAQDLSPDGSNLLERGLLRLYHAASNLAPGVRETITITGGQKIIPQPRVKGLDESYLEELPWRLAQALAMPIRTRTPTTRLGLGRDWRDAADEAVWRSDRDKLLGQGRRNGHIRRRLIAIAESEGAAGVRRALADMSPSDRRVASQYKRDISLALSQAPTARRLMAFASSSANATMQAIIDTEDSWRPADAAAIKALVGYKLKSARNPNLELYSEFLSTMERIERR